MNVHVFIPDHADEMSKNILLLVVSVFASVISVELLTRIFYSPAPKEIAEFRLSTSNYYRIDDELGWMPQKNIRGVHNRLDSFTSSFTTNSIGLRDKEYGDKIDFGKIRIVALGDSFTWGFGVNDGEIYVDKIEEFLPSVEVVNLGVTAYNLRQEIIYLKRLGIHFKPQIVLVGFSLNDIYRTGDRHGSAAPATPSLDGRELKDVMADPPSTLRRIKVFLSRNSAFYKLFQDTTNTNKPIVKLLVSVGLKEPLAGFDGLDTNLMPALKVYPPPLAESLEQTKNELLEIKEVTDELGVPLVVALIPSLQSVDDRAFKQAIAYTVYEPEDFDLDKPYRIFAEFGPAHGIAMVTPIDTFRKAAAAGNKLYLNRDMHFNKYGHELFAREIASYLIAAGLVGQ